MGVVFQKGGVRKTQRVRYVPLISNSTSGTASRHHVLDGRGAIIDSAKYLKADDWSDNGDGTWSTAANSFPSNNARVPSWYRDSSGELHVFEVNPVAPPDYDLALNNEGEATWVSSNSSVKLKCSTNPFDTYGEIAIPTLAYGIVNTGDYVTIRGYITNNLLVSGIRNSDSDTVHITKNHVAYTGGGASTLSLPRAGNGISNQGNNSDVTMDYNYIWQTYDAALSAECTDSVNAITMTNMIADNNWIDRCSGCYGYNSQVNPSGGTNTMTGGAFTNNRASNIGYGWCGYKNSTDKDGCSSHGKVISLKNHEDAATMDIDISDNVVDTYAWNPIITYTFTNITITNNGGANTWSNPTRAKCSYDGNAGQCASHLTGDTSIASADANIVGNGVSTTTITYTLKDKWGTQVNYPGGDTIVPSTTLGAISTGTDNGDGTWSATLTSAATTGTATIGGTLNGDEIVDTITVNFT